MTASGTAFLDLALTTLAATGLVVLRGGIGLSLQSSFGGARMRGPGIVVAIESDDAFRSVRAGAGEKLAARAERLNSNTNFILRRGVRFEDER
jgi:hypothetical protein